MRVVAQALSEEEKAAQLEAEGGEELGTEPPLEWRALHETWAPGLLTTSTRS